MTAFWAPLAVLFSGLFIGLASGLPMAFTLGSSAMITTFFFWGPNALYSAGTSVYGMMRNLVLIAMPLFILMAAVLEKSGIADALYDAMSQWMGPLRGGLAIATVMICTVIAAMSGVTTAGTVTMGLIALPVMLRKGYDKTIAIGGILAGGALGILIPPSVSFVIYGMLTRTSIGSLFAGGLIPGLILSFFYMTFIGLRAFLKPHLGPPVPKEERLPFRQKLVLSRGLILPILLIIAVLGSIFGGIASPTESAAVGAAGAIICAAINRRFSWKMLKEATYRTFAVNGMIMWILFGAICYANVFVATGGPDLVRKTMLGMDVPPLLIIFFMQITYFILGCFVDEITILFITIPVYMPILTALGFNPIWFGVLFMVNMQMAYLTPPFGFTLFYMRGVAPPQVTMMDIYRSVLPFVALQWIGLSLVLFFPQLALWLPNVVFGLK